MKDFLIIGNLNAVTYKQVFPLIKAGEVRLGVHANTTMKFVSPYENVQGDGNEIAVPAVTWYTTLTHDRINPPLVLTATYTPEAYPRYDNYDAIEVSRTKDIPCDYYGVMGVPISFLDKWCPEQFEIVGITRPWSELNTKRYGMCECVHPDGRRERRGALDASAGIEVPAPPEGSVYYVHGGKLYVQFYPRLLVRKKKLE